MRDATPLLGHVVEAEQPRLSTHWVEHAISYTLRAGVLLAATIILAGVMLFVAGSHAGSAPGSFTALIHTHASPISLVEIARGAAQLDAIAVIELGSSC